ncbi:MAG TPA: CBS domain-containing protein [Thermoanaerobaculia bacterium]|nr:CBS domain-containing protein [Thermoanaerobaculia bacterium]
MRLKEIMKRDVVTLGTEAAEDEAREQMRRNRIHHIVVTRGADVVGIVSDRDLETFEPGTRIARTVGDLMTPSVATATSTTTIREAANLMRGRTIGCLPVIEKGRLAGIVTTSDLLTLLGKGSERPVNQTKRWIMKGRGPRRKASASV